MPNKRFWLRTFDTIIGSATLVGLGWQLLTGRHPLPGVILIVAGVAYLLFRVNATPWVVRNFPPMLRFVATVMASCILVGLFAPGIIAEYFPKPPTALETIYGYLHNRTIVYVQPLPFSTNGFTLDHIGDDQPALNVEVLAWDQDKGLLFAHQVVQGKNINPGGGIQSSQELFTWMLASGLTKITFKISDTKWRSVQELWILKTNQSAALQSPDVQVASRVTDEVSGETIVACRNPRLAVPWNTLKVTECTNWPLFRTGSVVPERTGKLSW
jgi:hypothetical protein